MFCLQCLFKKMSCYQSMHTFNLVTQIHTEFLSVQCHSHRPVQAQGISPALSPPLPHATMHLCQSKFYVHRSQSHFPSFHIVPALSNFSFFKFLQYSSFQFTLYYLELSYFQVCTQFLPSDNRPLKARIKSSTICVWHLVQYAAN